MEIATFAGGCFWCMEAPFKELDGVIEVFSGYANGNGEEPTCRDYAQKGYIESVQVIYDPEKIDYEKLLERFWRQIDPTDDGGQFADRGPGYRSAIFYHNEEQKKLAVLSKQQLQDSKRFLKPIVTEILPATNFFKAEGYHQNYYKTNEAHYKAYRTSSGRDAFLYKTWQSTSPEQPSEQELRKKLTSEQYDVMKKNKTEKPFTNEYCDNKRPGIYVDRISGEPLFSSNDKFDSKTGWPSFTQPLHPENIIIKKDESLGMSRTEVRTKNTDAHLGHVFDDGPAPNGLRYCLNSAALRFIPFEDLEKEGYGKYKKLFVLPDASKDALQDERE